MPVAQAPGEILNCGLRARLRNVNATGVIRKITQEGCRDASSGQSRMFTDLPQVPEVGLQSGELAFAQRSAEPVERFRAARPMYDYFRQHWIVKRCYFGSRLHPGLDARLLGPHNVREHAGAGLKILCGVLCVNPRLDRTSRRPNVELAERKILARGQSYRPLHQVDARHFFSHAMLHLQARVDLEKIEIPGGVVVDKLDGARRLVAYRLAELNRGLQKPLPDCAPESRCGRFFDDLLVPPLYRAIALAKSGYRAAAIAEDLNLNVPGLGNESFQVQSAASKVRLAQSRNRIESLVQLRRRSTQPDADATAARCAFQHYWISDAAGGFDRAVNVFEQSTARQ